MKKKELGTNKPEGFYCRNEFIEWLIDDEKFTTGSANSYASYVASANKNIIINYLNGSSFFEILKSAIELFDKSAIEDLIDYVVGVIVTEAETNIVTKYRNGLIQYRNFLIQRINGDDFTEDKEPSKTPALSLEEKKKSSFLKNIKPAQQLSYDKETLKKIFVFRMITQDRCYGEVYFPISFLKKLFYKDQISRKFFDEYVENQVNNIKLHTNSGTFFLSSIKALSIGVTSTSEASVTIIHDDDTYSLLFTKLDTGNDITPMKTFKLSKIAIDHIFPMKIILEEQKHALPALERITKAFKNSPSFKLNKGINGKMIKNISNELLASATFNQNDVLLLKEEMNHIQGFIDLQLMDGALNLLKKAKYENPFNRP